jgi:PhzF family phenazine biosynthesis protein
MAHRFTQVDAFTDRPFAGNPAAVFVLDAPRDAGWMQAVAREMNLSETSFLLREADAYRLRWFTPTVEVSLCGHATLAAAHALWDEGHLLPSLPAQFLTRSGPLTATRRGEEIEMDFPAKPADPTEPPPGLADALGVAVCAAGQNGLDFLVEVASEADLRAMQPNLSRLGELPVRGVIVTSRSATPEFDFVSRFFAPQSGVPEDPVTGSAHCCLAPYWGERLGKTEMVGYQTSQRGGVVRVRWMGPRVVLAGRAVTVVRGELVGAA